VTDTTVNQGAVPVPASTTAFYLSLDFAYSPTGDAFLGSRGVPSLPASGTSTASTPLVIPPGTAPGVYYVIGLADWGAAVAEAVETNNVRISGSLRVGPDLVVTAVSGPASVVAGDGVSAGDTTMNQGGAAVAASVTRFYLSSNTALDAGDILLASRAVPPLGAGASHTGSVMLTIPAATSAGTYVIIAAADGDLAIAEAAENNNTRPKVITVSVGP
jgi:subtilase family serine protease